jgi:DNA polymerase III subunit epsilon
MVDLDALSAGILVVGFLAIVAVVPWLLLTRPRTRTTVDSRHPSVAPIAEDDERFRQAVPERFVVFDLETTGLDPARHEIIEIAAIKVNRDSDTHEAFQYLVKPRKRIPKNITRINGITQQMVDHDGQPLESVLREFAEFVEKLPLVSFNADFDMGFLERSTTQHGIVIRNRVSCALKMARRAWPGRDSYRLCDLARDGGLPLEDMHRALGDCKRTIFVYTGAAVKLASKRRRRRTGAIGR